MRGAIVVAVLLASFAGPAAAQSTSAVWITGGLRHSGPLLRFAPPTPESGGDVEPSHIQDAALIRIGVRTDTPIRRFGAEVSVGTTVGADVAVRRLFRESCGPTCTRATQRSVEIGSVAIHSANLDVTVAVWQPGPVTLSALVGGRLQYHDFDTDSFSEPYSDAFVDIWGAGAGYGLRGELWAGRARVGVELRRNHIRLLDEVADDYERTQGDFAISLGAGWML